MSVLLTLVVGLDFSSPFIAGAFRFEADESLDGLMSTARSILPRPLAAPAPVRPAENPGSPRHVSPRPAPESRAHEQWVGDLRRAHAPASHPPSSTEEH